MIEKNVDIWEELSKSPHNNKTSICCTTNQIVKNNGSLTMGAGLAKQFAEKYLFLPIEWGLKVKNGHKGIICSQHLENRVYDSGIGEYNELDIYWLVALPTKKDWKNSSILPLIISGCRDLLKVSNIFSWETILMARPGCGLGGLKWEHVKKELYFLDDRFIICNKENYAQNN